MKTLLRWFDRVIRAFFPRKRIETEDDIRSRRILEDAGVEVIAMEANLPYGIVSGRSRNEIERKIKFNLYKSKDREAMERLELPPIKDGIFVLDSGEFCAGTDVQYAALRGVADQKEQG